MKNIVSSSVLLLLLSSFSIMPFNKKLVHPFNLRNVDGRWLSFNDYPEAKGFIIVFTCNHCPFAKLYPERLNQLYKKYFLLQVPLLAINSTDSLTYDEESFSDMQDKAEAENFEFPYLQDPSQSVAKDFNAKKTPHAFVVWKEKNQWIIRYDGAIDDNGVDPEKVTKAYVENAVNALLAGKPVEAEETNSIGCVIKMRN